MKRTILVMAIAAAALPALAQQATQRGADGAITVARPVNGSGNGTPGAQPPLVVVGGTRESGTDWVTPATSDITLGTGTGNRSVRLNPKGGDVSLSRGTAATAPTVMRNGASSRWVAKSKGCPAYYTGSITWQAEERQTITNPAWVETGAIRNYAEACTAVVETRWIGQSAACPAGYSGSHTWEAEERRSGGGAWAATGATRSQQNSCTAPPPPPPPPPVEVPPTPAAPGECPIKVATYALSTAPLPVPLPPVACGTSNRGTLASSAWNRRGTGTCQSYQANYQCGSNGWQVLAYNSSDCGGLRQTGAGDHLNGNWDAVLETAWIADEMYGAGKSGPALWDSRPAGHNALVGYGCATTLPYR